MNFTFAHNNLNVFDLDRSLSFYKEAFGIDRDKTERCRRRQFYARISRRRRNAAPFGTHMAQRHGSPYELGDNEIHLAFEVDDFDAALAKHKEMGCVCFENPAMGIYFTKILTDTGWRSYLRNNPYTIQVCDQISTISKSKTAASRISRSRKRLSLLYFAKSSVL